MMNRIKKKRVICILLCMCMVFLLMPSMSFAATDFKPGEAGTCKLAVASGMTVRDKPATTGYTKLGTLKLDEKVTVLEAYILGERKYPNWHKISYKGKEAYVSANNSQYRSAYYCITVSDNPEVAAAKTAAKTAVTKALDAMAVSNTTTDRQILEAARAALPAGATINFSGTFSKRLCTETSAGRLSAPLTIYVPNGSVSFTYTKVIPAGNTGTPIVKPDTPDPTPVVTPTTDDAKLAADKKTMRAAISALDVTNKTTWDDLLKAAQSGALYGTKAELVKGATKREATFQANGLFYGTIKLTLNDKTVNMTLSEKIAMLVREMPTDKISVNKSEWEILRLVNVQRAKKDRSLLTMVAQLQTACDTREKELYTKYSHTRPNGKTPNTAISSSLKYTRSGENICRGTTRTPASSMKSWMNSKGHRNNILKKTYDYLGVGVSKGRWVQLFTDGGDIVSCTTSAKTMHFADAESMMKEYLICETEAGVKSYMPLDTASLKKVTGGYTVKLAGGKTFKITIG